MHRAHNLKYFYFVFLLIKRLLMTLLTLCKSFPVNIRFAFLKGSNQPIYTKHTNYDIPDDSFDLPNIKILRKKHTFNY